MGEYVHVDDALVEFNSTNIIIYQIEASDII
jgi:hypothetical protein